MAAPRGRETSMDAPPPTSIPGLAGWAHLPACVIDPEPRYKDKVNTVRLWSPASSIPGMLLHMAGPEQHRQWVEALYPAKQRTETPLRRPKSAIAGSSSADRKSGRRRGVTVRFGD